MKKTPNLKQRLDDLRHEPQPPVEMTLLLEADQYQKLQALALQQNLSVAAYIVRLLCEYTAAADDDAVE